MKGVSASEERHLPPEATRRSYKAQPPFRPARPRRSACRPACPPFPSIFEKIAVFSTEKGLARESRLFGLTPCHSTKWSKSQVEVAVAVELKLVLPVPKLGINSRGINIVIGTLTYLLLR